MRWLTIYFISINYKLWAYLDLMRCIMNYCWTPGKNEIVSIKDAANNQDETPVTSEITSKIEQIFFSDKAQIAEQFKNIMNRMNDL